MFPRVSAADPAAKTLGELFSNFEEIREIEARVWSQVDDSVSVPTELPGFIQYRFRQAARIFPDGFKGDDLTRMMDSCAEDVHDAKVAIDLRREEEGDDFWKDEIWD